MPTNFNFVADDPIVQRYLDPTERSQVTRWQRETALWTFEFHEGHTAGYPLYVRAANETSNKNLPKMLTEDKRASDYASLTSLANGGKLVSQNSTGKLESKGQRDLLDVISGSWTKLQTLAQRFWDNEPVTTTTPAPVVVTAAATTYRPCSDDGCGGQVPVVASGKAACDTCWRYQ